MDEDREQLCRMNAFRPREVSNYQSGWFQFRGHYLRRASLFLLPTQLLYGLDIDRNSIR